MNATYKTRVSKFIEHIFIEHLLYTPDTDLAADNTAEDKTHKKPCPYRALGAYILVKSR